MEENPQRRELADILQELDELTAELNGGYDNGRPRHDIEKEIKVLTQRKEELLAELGEEENAQTQ